MKIYLNKYFENFVDNNYAKIDDKKLEALKNEVINSLNADDEIFLNFDGGFGYTNNFIELIIEFLNLKFGDNNLLKKIKVKSDDEPSIIEHVTNLLRNN